MNSSFSLQDTIFGAELQSITEICANIKFSAQNQKKFDMNNSWANCIL